MDRAHFHALIHDSEKLDYRIYLNTERLFRCQKDFAELCNHDELQFQIVHQVEELWMKLMVHTLLEIDDYLRRRETNRVVTLFRRVHSIQRLMIEQLGLLETMSPKEYQVIRLQLGQGSGRESPGFRTLLKMSGPLWESYVAAYLDGGRRTVEQVYDSEYGHDDAYVVAEALIEFDELFQKFRYHHIQLIHRSIGLKSKSLRGASVELLEKGLQVRFFPELWQIRYRMTDAWGGEYGVVRDHIAETEG